MLEVLPDKLLLTVQDDGIGLTEGDKVGRGLRNIKARAEEMGGKVTVTSDKGTRVGLILPLPLRFKMQE